MVNSFKIRQLIKFKNITQQKFAEEIGLSVQGLVRIYKKGNTTTDNLEKIAKYFNVPISYFFDNETDEQFFLNNVGNFNTGNNVEQGSPNVNSNGMLLAENVVLRKQLIDSQKENNLQRQEIDKLKNKIIKLLEK